MYSFNSSPKFYNLTPSISTTATQTLSANTVAVYTKVINNGTDPITIRFNADSSAAVQLNPNAIVEFPPNAVMVTKIEAINTVDGASTTGNVEIILGVANV